MDEAILIDIAKRFRALEDACEMIPGHHDLREDIANRLEACRDDMNRMMDEIRKAKACA